MSNFGWNIPMDSGPPHHPPGEAPGKMRPIGGHLPNAPLPPLPNEIPQMQTTFVPQPHPIYPPLHHMQQGAAPTIPMMTTAAVPPSTLNLSKSIQWLPGSDGSIPAGAFVGGQDIDGSPLFVARARFGGALLPGKMRSSHQGCYVAWGGKENLVKHYEVLCNFDGEWKPARKDQIPDRALEAGHSETGEKLFVGRAFHKKTPTPGKVHKSHKCCYISFAGKEVAYKEFEVLVPK